MQKLIKTTCKIAAENIGRERAKHIAEKAQRRYEKLCLENTSDPKALRAHTFKRIYPAIAAYEALREDGVDQEKAAWYRHSMKAPDEMRQLHEQLYRWLE